MERVHKSPELPKAIKKLECSADYDLGNIQNATPSMHLINTKGFTKLRMFSLARLMQQLENDISKGKIEIT